jgi:hypothetical protein
LDREGLQWFKRNDAAQILKLMACLSEVEWRAGLTDQQRLRWASPLSVMNRCPAFGRLRGPVVHQRPITVSELLKMPAAQAAHRRVTVRDGDRSASEQAYAQMCTVDPFVQILSKPAVPLLAIPRPGDPPTDRQRLDVVAARKTAQQPRNSS